MPVKWLMPWQPSPGTTVSIQVLNEVSQCAEALGGVKGGRWRSSLTFYRPMLRDQALPAECPKDFLGLALQDRPDRYYFIIRGRIVVEAEAGILAIMEKLQSYKARVTLHFEGFQYQVGDFLLRVGKVVPANSENLRGIMMEEQTILRCQRIRWFRLKKQCHLIIIKLTAIFFFPQGSHQECLLLLIGHELDQNHSQQIQTKWSTFPSHRWRSPGRSWKTFLIFGMKLC